MQLSTLVREDDVIFAADCLTTAVPLPACLSGLVAFSLQWPFCFGQARTAAGPALKYVVPDFYIALSPLEWRHLLPSAISKRCPRCAPPPAAYPSAGLHYLARDFRLHSIATRRNRLALSVRSLFADRVVN